MKTMCCAWVTALILTTINYNINQNQWQLMGRIAHLKERNMAFRKMAYVVDENTFHHSVPCRKQARVNCSLAIPLCFTSSSLFVKSHCAFFFYMLTILF